MDETPEQTIARLTQQVSDLTTKNTELEGKISSTTGQLRETNHKATFRAEALKAGVREKAVESLYREVGYDPGEQDQADAAAITSLIESRREDLDFYFEPPAAVETTKPAETGATGAKPATTNPVTPRPIVGASKGRTPPANDKFRVTKANTSDPTWLFENQKAYHEALKNKTLEFVD